MVDWAWEEMKGAAIQDARIRRSLADVCERLSDNPEATFSVAAGPAGRQVANRVFRKDGKNAVGITQLLAGHREQTAARVAGEDWVLVAQDTSVLSFVRTLPSRKSGLKRQCVVREFQAHSALALTERGVPLGVVHLDLWVRPKGDRVEQANRTETDRSRSRQQRSIAEKESRKWLQGLAATEEVLPPGTQTLVIQDREGAVFELFAAPRRERTHLLVRAAQPRKVTALPGDAGDAPSQGLLFETAAAAPVCGQVRIVVPAQLTGRPAAGGAKERDAELTLRMREIEIPRPWRPKGSAPLQPQRLWLLQAAEEEPPEGEEPIYWVLLATVPPKPERKAEHAQWLVQCYALRWRIERLHFVLKQGLKVEENQHRERAIQQIIALSYLVAWRLLACLYWSRERPECAAEELFSPIEVTVLSAQSGRHIRTVSQAVEALARLAGYQPYRNAKPPGIKRLWEGHQRLQVMVEGYRLHQLGPTCAPDSF
jgi:hypothetical protein